MLSKRLEWKESKAAAALSRAARSAGKWVHMGRVNSLRRFERARYMGCHSADGTYIKYDPNINMPKMPTRLCWSACERPGGLGGASSVKRIASRQATLS